jgi:hypothetical protein
MPQADMPHARGSWIILDHPFPHNYNLKLLWLLPASSFKVMYDYIGWNRPLGSAFLPTFVHRLRRIHPVELEESETIRSGRSRRKFANGASTDGC